MSKTEDTNSQWWLLTADQPAGPFTDAYVALRLRCGGITSETLLCRVGEVLWRPLSQWPEFGSSVNPYESPEPDHSSSRSVATLPGMARAICIYGLYLSPVLFALENFLCVALGLTYRYDSRLFDLELLTFFAGGIFGVIGVGLLAFGALQLRALNKLGCRLMIAGLAVSCIWMVIAQLLSMLLSAIDTSLPDQHFSLPDDSTPLIRLLVVLLFFLFFLPAYIFQFTALAWLPLNGRDLPFKTKAFPERGDVLNG